MNEPEAHVATVILGRAVSKLEALDALASLAGATVVDAGTARPRVPLGEGAWAQVEIPKFGEPPPLAIDVVSPLSLEHAQLAALRLAAAFESREGWPVRPAFLA